LRVAQMGHEAHSVADGYQHCGIARAANFDVPQTVGVGSARLNRLNIRARDPMLSQDMCFAPQRRHFVFHVAYVQRPRGGKPGVNESIGAMPRSAIRNTGNSTVSIQVVEEPVIFRRKSRGHSRFLTDEPRYASLIPVLPSYRLRASPMRSSGSAARMVAARAQNAPAGFPLASRIKTREAA
jgi:hypothetical protein